MAVAAAIKLFLRFDGQTPLHRNGRLPDERARQRAGRRQPARRGLRAGRQPAEADTILFNTCSVRQHAEDKIYSALGRLKQLKQAGSAQDHRRAGLHGPEGPAADLRAGSARGPGRRAGPVAPDCRSSGAGAAGARAADRGEPRPQGRQPRRTVAARASAATTRCATARCGRSPLSGDGADHVRLRQVLHLLHRAQGARARSRAARPTRSWTKSGNWPTRAAARSRCWARPSTATSDTQRGRTLRLSDLLARLQRRSRACARLKFVTNYPRHMTRRSACGGARSAQGLALPARAGAERLRTRSCSG